MGGMYSSFFQIRFWRWLSQRWHQSLQSLIEFFFFLPFVFSDAGWILNVIIKGCGWPRVCPPPAAQWWAAYWLMCWGTRKEGRGYSMAGLSSVMWCVNVFHHCFPDATGREAVVRREHTWGCVCFLTSEFLYCWFLNNTVGCSKVVGGNKARRKIASCTFTMPVGSPLNLIRVILISKTVLTGAWKGRKIFLIKHQSSSSFIGQPFWRRNSL